MQNLEVEWGHDIEHFENEGHKEGPVLQEAVGDQR